MSKKNCWEFKNCGRESGGAKAAFLGVCPASSEKRLDKIHDGINGGRTCWIIAGTLCKGEIQGEFAKKFQNCQSCDFYLATRAEESGHFQLSTILLAKLK